MEGKTASGTAFMTAFLRGFHALHDEPKIFDDSLAYYLLPEQVRVGIEKHLANSSSQMAPELAGDCIDEAAALQLGVRTMAGSILARARYVEDRLEESIRKGVKQYVILGAGLDTFAFRRLDLVDRLEIFEVDHPATQEVKRLLLARLGLKEPDYLHFIPVDFTLESLDSAFTRSTYDPQSPSFFSWTGVTHYLPLEAIYATLSTIVKLSNVDSEIVFDYWDHLAFDPEKASNRIKSLIESTRRIGEPIITGFDPSRLGGELARLGLHLLENLGPEEIQQRYLVGGGGGYSISKHVHFACAAVE